MHRDFVQVIRDLENADPRRGIRLIDRKFREVFHPYTELHRKVVALDAVFRSQGVRRGDRVLLSLSADVESICSFFALICIGAVPVSVASPLVSQDRDAYFDGLVRTVAVAGVNRILATDGLERLTEGGHPRPPRVTTLRPEGSATDGREVERPRVEVDPDDTVFIQFSSGSTSHPKGVRITHRNLMHNLTIIVKNDRRTEESVMVSWLPLCHDMGLVGCLLTNLLLQNDLVLMNPLCFILRPVSWLAAVSRSGGTVTAVPNFALDLCVDRVTETQLREHRIELDSFRYVYCGSEPVRPVSIARFERKFGPYGFAPGSIRPVYGMSEATLIVTAPDPDPERSVVTRRVAGMDVVSVGRPLDDFRLRIDEGNGTDLGADRVGEIWIRGTSVTPGYIGDPTDTGGLFRDGWLRTGDLGMLDAEGRLYVTGRLKDLIIHQGRNFYSHDIVTRLEELPFVRKGKMFAFGTMIEGDEELVVMFVPPPEEEPERLDDEIRSRVLREFGLPVHDIVRVKHIPKTTSGKINRGRCEAMYRAIRASTGSRA